VQENWSVQIQSEIILITGMCILSLSSNAVTCNLKEHLILQAFSVVILKLTIIIGYSCTMTIHKKILIGLKNTFVYFFFDTFSR